MVRILSGEDQLRNLFAGLLENTLHAEMGVPDPGLVDYLTTLLLRFVRHESIFKIRDLRGHRLEEVAGMLAEAEQCADRPRREIHRHIGDFTLFWTGLYPEGLKVLKSWDRKDSLIDYREQGKRSYYIASTFEQEPYEEEAPILRRLSELYDVCTEGLQTVRREWELNF
ncbi:hypothetical protein [Rubinisphaera margarita]|uniref:hypothetical protein n=1 Tax=Rubinisphaera margarita TaxID=2909586 RepID=UPI001EE89F88|nr:hypothetical protein [Rubinisphaera margarita]MCG6154376.1 hypothetical protein [Rubinisphaera margarita]